MSNEARKRIVLIVEDSAPLADVISDLMNAEPGYSAVSVGDGEDALAVTRGMLADVVLLDVGLPRLNGWQVYDALRADPATRDVPVIFVTADPDRPEFAARGITHVIAKPFNVDDLLAEIEEVCGPAAPRPASGPADDPGDIEYFLAISG